MRLMTQVAVLGCWAADWPPGSSMATASASPSSRAAGLSSEAPSVRGSGMVHAPVGGWSSRVRVAPVVERVEKRPAPCGRREAVTITSKVAGIVEQIRFADGPARGGGRDAGAARLPRPCAPSSTSARPAGRCAQPARAGARQLQPGATIAAQRLRRWRRWRARPRAGCAQAEARLEELHVAAPFAGRWGCGRVTRAR